MFSRSNRRAISRARSEPTGLTSDSNSIHQDHQDHIHQDQNDRFTRISSSHLINSSTDELSIDRQRDKDEDRTSSIDRNSRNSRNQDSSLSSCENNQSPSTQTIPNQARPNQARPNQLARETVSTAHPNKNNQSVSHKSSQTGRKYSSSSNYSRPAQIRRSPNLITSLKNVPPSPYYSGQSGLTPRELKGVKRRGRVYVVDCQLDNDQDFDPYRNFLDQQVEDLYDDALKVARNASRRALIYRIIGIIVTTWILVMPAIVAVLSIADVCEYKVVAWITAGLSATIVVSKGFSIAFGVEQNGISLKHLQGQCRSLATKIRFLGFSDLDNIKKARRLEKYYLQLDEIETDIYRHSTPSIGKAVNYGDKINVDDVKDNIHSDLQREYYDQVSGLENYQPTDIENPPVAMSQEEYGHQEENLSSDSPQSKKSKEYKWYNPRRYNFVQQLDRNADRHADRNFNQNHQSPNSLQPKSPNSLQPNSLTNSPVSSINQQLPPIEPKITDFFPAKNYKGKEEELTDDISNQSDQSNSKKRTKKVAYRTSDGQIFLK